MIALKKLYGEELLRLALMLSLLRVDPEHYLRLDEARLLAGGLVNGTDWSPEISGQYQRSRIHHPKSIDSMLLDYERDVFEEMMSLGRWSNGGRASREEFQAYLLSGVESVNGQAAASVIQNTANQDLYSHLPVVQLDDDDVNECVTVKTEDDTSQDEDGACCATPQSYEQEVVIKTEDSDSEDESNLYQTRPVSLSDPPLIRNLSTFDGPLLEEDSGGSDSFDVTQFFSNPPTKTELKDVDLGYANSLVDSDDFFPFYLRDSDEDSIRDQNLADLFDFGETAETLEDFKRQMEESEEKHHPGEDLEKYLLENTDLDNELDLDRMYCTKRERASTSFTSVGSSSSGYSEDPCTSGASSCDESTVHKTADFEVDKDEGVFGATNLTQEDLDLIEVLWKQDVDLGFCLTASTPEPSDDKCPSADSLYNSEDQISLGSTFEDEDEIEKLKNDFESKKEEAAKSEVEEEPEDVKPNLMRSMSIEQRWQDLATLLALPTPQPGSAQLPGPADPHHHHLYPQHHHHVNSSLGHCSQGSPAYVGPPYAPLPTEKSSIAPTPDLYGPPNISTAVATSMNVSHESSGCAAAGGGPPPFYKAEHPPQEHQPDPMYYQNGTNEFNGTSDGFLSQILNDENFQLMDIAMNEGMYTMRMLESGDGGATGGGPLPPHLTQPPIAPHTMPNHHITMGSERIDASSDSAVSSMGSERVPSLSDGEWCDAGSDSAQDFHSKMRTCDNESRQQPLVAQKKHHMFGKRCLQDQNTLGRLRSDDHQMPDVKFEYEQPSAPISSYMPDVGHMPPEMKYSCTMEFNAGGVGIGMGSATGGLRHNHTYSLPRALPQPPHRPLARDKRGRKGPENPGLSACGTQAPLSRDEKRARALGIPLSVHDIINLPMDEFNERLSKHDLSETQLSLIRDIRRRGKNKVAAQNCRKRKLDQITSLADEVRDVRTRKQRLLRERNSLLEQRQRAKEHFAALYRHVFQHLRDADGNPLSSQQYSLQQAADGAVVVVPRSSASLLPDPRSPRTVKRNISTNGTSDDDMDRNKLKQRKSFDQ